MDLERVPVYILAHGDVALMSDPHAGCHHPHHHPLSLKPRSTASNHPHPHRPKQPPSSPLFVTVETSAGHSTAFVKRHRDPHQG